LSFTNILLCNQWFDRVYWIPISWNTKQFNLLMKKTQRRIIGI
jgi:hypothetical protein